MQLRAFALGGLCSGLVLGSVACLGPNPLITAGEAGTESATSDIPGDGDPGDGDPGDGDGDPGDGDPGDGDPGDGDGDPDGCANGMLDGDETDVDCGGSCDACEPGGACLDADDCDSFVCDADVCAAPSCVDEVENGDELEADCGGSCRFCEHSPFVDEFDDYDSGHALVPNVAMFEDREFALGYLAFSASEFRLRWFDEFATPLGPSLMVTTDLMQSVAASQGLVATDDVDTHNVYAVLNGENPMSSNRDVFSIRRGPNTPASLLAIYQGPAVVSYADIALDGDIATFVWEQDGEIFLRRYDYGLDLLVAPEIRANTDFATRPGKQPVVAQRNGVSVVAWIACDVNDPTDCDMELRSSDSGWLEDAPVQVGLDPHAYTYPQIAVAEDNRVAVVCGGGPANDNQNAWAAQFNAALAPDGSPWLLQGSMPSQTLADVAALESGDFVYAWSDTAVKRIRIRRFIGPDLPRVTNVGDEAPWAAMNNPGWVRLATTANILAVVWANTVDNFSEIQGQVLSY
ncbi:Chitinase [Enhygromyxa salina]|uniref:Chitinase n=1 Tax=Enhygromyxa salina TaxID=215803 RepID=A0A0C2D563_9BACT|nr:hypothetical protein [Enhygromyxa salina]KIG16835.1 Chitinase [Enhygromyxa salina]